MSKLLIVIPAHNEEANIVQVVEELTHDYPQYDYVVVNDGSRDKTAAVCRAHGYRLIDLPVNLGLAGAPCRWTPTANISRNISMLC